MKLKPVLIVLLAFTTLGFSQLVPEPVPQGKPPVSPETIGPRETVTLGWDQNTENDIVEYRVYLGTTSGTYTLFVPVLYVQEGVSPVTIALPEPASSYFFVVTAVNETGLESVPSNEVFSVPVIQTAPNPPSNFRLISEE